MGIVMAAVMLLSSVLFNKMNVDAMDEKTNCDVLIQEMVESIQEKDWNTYIDLMSSDEQGFYEWYFSEETYTEGIKQIQSIQLNEVFHLEYTQVKDELLYDAYPVLSESSHIESYLVELDCSVVEENIYFHNGINYYLIIFAMDESGAYKVAQFNQPSFALLENVIEPMLSGNAEENDEKSAALDIVKYAENGILVNAEGKIIIDDDYTILRQNRETGVLEDFTEELKNSERLRDNNYNDHPALDIYLYYSIPKNITVCLNKTGNSEVDSPTLEDYVKNTMPNEIYTSWKTAALTANAYCVKGVGIYRSIKPINANYMVSQGTQKYVPGTAVSTTNTIVDSISDYYVVNSDCKVFFPEYGAGSSGSAGTQGSGRLLQWGSQYLAKEESYTYSEILNYYYSGSDCSSGDLVYVSYGDA